MPPTVQRIKDSMKVRPTPQDKGLTLTITVTGYDNGMVQVDGVPINVAPDYDQGEGWLVAAEVVVSTINEFRKQVARRRKEQGHG
jgi:hypothetical protein